ncbi:NACHT, LRR and PYD domains-containing protein 3-like [Pocillopora verrucosa]|uniref:NACHT, LRR and PYD domains-containing protein 3-like n=1 Tax=Pocillopora verrucosa TaxID=203993 RepID=UPI0033426E35
MDNLKELLRPKTFNRVSHAAVVIWILIGVIFLGIFADAENSESRYDFRCDVAKGRNIDLVRGRCFELYEKQYNKHDVPIYAFVIMNFFLIGTVCVIYSQIASPTVDQLSPSARNGDVERQLGDQRNALSSKKLFIAYCCQLFARIVLKVLFMVLQSQFLYPLGFPSNFPCYLTSGGSQPRNSTDVWYECHNQRATKKNSWMRAVLVVNGIFLFGILSETVYILLRAWKEDSFMKNSKFLEAHLNPFHANSQNATTSTMLRLEPPQQEERTEQETNVPQEQHQKEESKDHEKNIPHLPSKLQEERTEQEKNVPQEQHQKEESKDHETNIPHLPSKLQEERTEQETNVPQEQHQEEESKENETNIPHLPSKLQEERTEQETNVPQEQHQKEESKDHETNIPHLPSKLQEERTEQETNVPQEQHQEEESKENETNIPHLPSKPQKLQKPPLQEFIENTKRVIKDETNRPPQLRSPFPSTPGKGHPAKHLTLDQIYTKLVVVPDIANYDFTGDRQEKMKVYARSSETKNTTPRGPEDILNHENKNVLIVGRPGIGKTLCCTKLLRDWAFNKVFHDSPDAKIHFDATFFIKFRAFNAAPDLSLRELLTLSEHSPSNHMDDEVWSYILDNPQRVLIIFDGIDEFKHNSKIGEENFEPKFRNRVDEKMPLYALYEKLATGKLLNGAAVLTTTRPTALPCIIDHVRFDKIYEILGFSSRQIKEYVNKFSAEEDEDARESLWRHIGGNTNILSLCYIPASCFIICSTLLQMVKFYASKSLSLPKNLTVIYKKAVKIFYFRHNEEFRGKNFASKFLESDKLPPEVEKKFSQLEKLAFEGIKEGRLVFGRKEVGGMEDSALFHRLPDRQPDAFEREEQFCFIHLTMQEFFAARHLANMNEIELRNFVSTNIADGKWQLVFQFLAGLMNEKENLPSEIITDLLPVKTEEKENVMYNEEWSLDMEPRKVTYWPTEDKKHLAVTLFKCINESSEMEEIVQGKLQQINFNFVNFHYCQLTPVDCASVVTVITNVQQISHLTLSNNNIGPLGCFEICKLLKCSKSQLSWLNLAGNQLTDEAAKYLAEAINNNNCQLRTLILSHDNISDIGAQHLAEAINNSKCQLSTLTLVKSNISDIGAQHLAEAINNNNCQLRTLILSENNISDIGAQHLAEAINNNNCQLRTLILAENNISDIGAQHLAETIKNNNCQLRELDLSENNISDIGAQHLAEAITSNNCQLHTLILIEKHHRSR